MSRYRVRIGDDFEIDVVDIDPQVDLEGALREHTRKAEACARRKVSFALLMAIGAALAIAGAMRLVDGDFRALQVVWAAVSVPLGWIARYYLELKD